MSFVQASLVVAVLVLLYCLYVVQDWLDMLTHDQVVHSVDIVNNLYSSLVVIVDL